MPHPRPARELLILGFALVVLLAVAWYLRGALLLIYVSSVFAVVLKPAVDRVHRQSFFGWHPGRGAALMLLLATVLVVLGTAAAFAIPPIVDDIGQFAATAPERVKKIADDLGSVPWLQRVDLRNLPSQVGSMLGGLQSVAAGMASGLMSLVTALLLVAYLILDGDELLQGMLAALPARDRDRLAGTLQRACGRMRNWLVGQAMLMLILGVASGVTFGLLGIPYFLALAVFAGIANVVPLLGPLLTVLVAGMVALTDAPWKALGVGVFYLAYQQVENAFLTPMIMKSQVELSSSVVVIALLLGSELAGVLGALVAVPSAVLIIEIANEYLVMENA